VTSSDDELGGSLYIGMQNDDKESEHRNIPRFLQSSGPTSSGLSRLSYVFEMEERKGFFYLMTKAKTQLVESVKKFRESKGSIDLRGISVLYILT
jgi:hypothetical protein